MVRAVIHEIKCGSAKEKNKGTSWFMEKTNKNDKLYKD